MDHTSGVGRRAFLKAAAAGTVAAAGAGGWAAEGKSGAIEMEAVLKLNVAPKLGQFRAVAVRMKGGERGILGVYCGDAEIDPWHEMFYFPTDTLKLILFKADGQVLWRRDLGRGVVPGLWFCPVYVFDLDGDGTEEIWLVGNTDADHPFSKRSAVLERIDAMTGQTTGRWPWPDLGPDQCMSHAYRNFIMGGYVRGEPVLLTAQGTYEFMAIQGWRADMKTRWRVQLEGSSPGARGSHMCPVVDINSDGIDELMWGERCVELDGGKELFCADRAAYRGHSDIVQPVWDRAGGRWLIYTCRESDPSATPRMVMYDQQGKRMWGAVDRGHMDMGWVARLDGGGPVAMAIRIGQKSAGPGGVARANVEEFVFDALTGKERKLPFSVYRTLPVDLNGDGKHELVRGLAGAEGEVLDSGGKVVAMLGGMVSMASKFLDWPGEQVLTYQKDGTVRIWADRSAQDRPEALARYGNAFYRASQRLTACGYNLVNLGGL